MLLSMRDVYLLQTMTYLILETFAREGWLSAREGWLGKEDWA